MRVRSIPSAFNVITTSQEITEISAKSSEQKCLCNVQIHDFLQFDEENWKNKGYVKKVNFCPNLHEI